MSVAPRPLDSGRAGPGRAVFDNSWKEEKLATQLFSFYQQVDTYLD